ncbi:hypothetical protein SBRY_20215 [Actinacidiphila bryophytorum]|uniref:Uncharacterized protein n=1 Tax=Actinacidiphila bryophytorum TaxID=1436133 RepID=A0A9W4E5L7_9ACTN|nr:hypothetical protein SBRY_20215 [Actinacidiphila bryophytorum]
MPHRPVSRDAHRRAASRDDRFSVIWSKSLNAYESYLQMTVFLSLRRRRHRERRTGRCGTRVGSSARVRVVTRHRARVRAPRSACTALSSARRQRETHETRERPSGAQSDSGAQEFQPLLGRQPP